MALSPSARRRGPHAGQARVIREPGWVRQAKVQLSDLEAPITVKSEEQARVPDLATLALFAMAALSPFGGLGDPR